MEAEQLVGDLAGVAGMMRADSELPDSLIGLFQALRPAGLPKAMNLETVAGGFDFGERINELYAAVRDSHRTDSMKDAYFIVRNPPMLTADQAEEHANRFMKKLLALANLVELESAAELLASEPEVRVLEGKAPKHPRNQSEQAGLLDAIQKRLPEAVGSLFPAGSLGDLLAEPLYFVATDRLLRDYLRWPLIDQGAPGLLELDPYGDYFQLWRHGAKIRIFADDRVDVYLPRRSSGELIESSSNG